MEGTKEMIYSERTKTNTAHHSVWPKIGSCKRHLSTMGGRIETHQSVLPPFFFKVTNPSNYMTNTKTKSFSAQWVRACNAVSQTQKRVFLVESGAVKNLLSKHKIYIGRYNMTTMRTEDNWEELQQELRTIKWDIVGLCKTWLEGEYSTVPKSGHTLYQFGK